MKTLPKEYVDNNKAVCVIGIPNSGKTHLAFALARMTAHEKRYTLGYPKKVDGFENIYGVDELALLENCVLVIDEFSKFFPIWSKKTNTKLMEFLQFAEHNQVKLILTTQFSQAITRVIEGLIPCYAVKQVLLDTLKNGSIVKNALKNKIKHPNLNSDFVKVKTSEFVWFNAYAGIGENGIYEFGMQEDIKKDWGTKAK